MKFITQQRLILNTVVIIILLSCNYDSNRKNEINLLSIENRKLSLSDFADSIKYIPLDGTILIKFINKIEIDDSLFIISTSPDGILIFNYDGKLVRKIGKIGRGPSEYLNGVNFTIDKLKNNILVYNGMGNVLKYDYLGNYLGNFSLPTEITIGKIDFYNATLMISYPLITSKVKQCSQFLIIDSLANIIIDQKNTNYFFTSDALSFTSTLTYYFKNNVHYWNQYNDTIYQLDNSLIKKKYILKKGKYKLTPEFVSNIKDFKNLENFIVIRDILESRKYLFFIYDLFNRQNLTIYNKEAQITFSTIKLDNNEFRLINDLDNGVSFCPQIIFERNGNEYMAMEVGSYELLEHIKDINLSNKSSSLELRRLSYSLNENDNPLLMLVRLKNWVANEQNN